jgi:hypothetical protein
MAEQRPHGGRRHTGARSRAGRSWPPAGAASGPASGRPSPARAPSTARDRPSRLPASDPCPTPEPVFLPRTTGTRATYRQLLLRGLSPEEAADLTAFLAGFAIGSRPWKLIEINRILFLGALARSGTWGPEDGAAGHSS